MLGLFYSIASYGLFLSSFTYFAVFSDGILVPRTVDSGSPTSIAVAAIVNLSLVLAFGLQHSIMARASFKRVLTRVCPPALERATYVLASSLVLILLMWQWHPWPSVLWHVDSPAAAATLWSINALGWLGVPASSFLIDHFDLFGIKRALHAFRRTTVAQKGFVTPLFYKYLRHPMMTSLMVGLWVTPHMTVGHAVLAAAMTIYILIGVRFEERSLAKELGAEYERYQATTPKFFPV
ncbi:MAG TPA: isoprenylcysteine carboxylmethyltransferase family protein [Kofleriaceae bacterium]|jgi:protein-S-isoprenylcysteine O-methyltransferase Ste14